MECAQSVLECRDALRGNAIILPCGACASSIRLGHRERKPIGEAGSGAVDRPDHHDTTPSLTRTPWRANLASSAISSIRCRSHRAGRDVWLPSRKTAICCHLLPFSRCKTVRLVAICPISCPSGVPASLGPGLRTVSGAVRILGAKLSSRASLSHDPPKRCFGAGVSGRLFRR